MRQLRASLLHSAAALLTLQVEQSELELQPNPEVETRLLSLSYVFVQNQSSGPRALHLGASSGNCLAY